MVAVGRLCPSSEAEVDAEARRRGLLIAGRAGVA
jgi:hypothetical protein